jgi:viroplasmin and RNaseH domain-containing protein
MSRRNSPYNYYVILKGLDPGIYREWNGGDGARARVDGYSGAIHKGFYTLRDAIEYYKEMTSGQEPVLWFKQPPHTYFAVTEGKERGIYDNWFGSDGACLQLEGFRQPSFKGFYDIQEAITWYKHETGMEPVLRISNEQK